MYAVICSTDVRGGDHQTYALQTVYADVRGTNGHTLLFEYPLDNTWTYEEAVEPLGNNQQTYAHWLDVRCFSEPINSTLPPSYFAQLHMPLGCQSVLKVSPECFQSVLNML
jgi:hypothetical protein